MEDKMEVMETESVVGEVAEADDGNVGLGLAAIGAAGLGIGILGTKLWDKFVGPKLAERKAKKEAKKIEEAKEILAAQEAKDSKESEDEEESEE